MYVSKPTFFHNDIFHVYNVPCKFQAGAEHFNGQTLGVRDVTGHPRKPKTAGYPEPCCYWKWFLGRTFFFEASHGILRPMWVNILRFAMGRTLPFFWGFPEHWRDQCLNGSTTNFDWTCCLPWFKGYHFHSFFHLFTSVAWPWTWDVAVYFFDVFPHCIFKMFFLIASRDVRTLSYVTRRIGINIHSVTNFWSSKSRSHRT